MFFRCRRRHQSLDPAIFKNAIYPIFIDFTPYLTAQENLYFYRTNKYSQRHYGDVVWKNLHTQQYGKMYYEGDYQLQYLCAAQLQVYKTYKLSNPLRSCDFISSKIICTAAQHQYKSWSLYYLAEVSENMYLKYQWATRALAAGDYRTGDLIAGYFKNMNFAPSNNPWFLELSSYQDVFELQRAQSMMNAWQYVCTRDSQYLEKALTAFFNYYQPQSQQVQNFLDDLFNIMYRTDILPLGSSNDHNIKRKIHTIKATTILEAMDWYFSSYSYLPIYDYMMASIKKYADTNAVDGAFTYANILARNVRQKIVLQNLYREIDPLKEQELIQQMITAKDYFIKAYQAGRYEAIANLRFMVNMRKDYCLVSKEEMEQMLDVCFQHKDKTCLWQLATELRAIRRWDKNIYNIWIIQEAARFEEHSFDPNKKTLFNALMNPEASVHVRCAVAFLLGLEGQREQSLEHYKIALYMDENAFTDYMQIGEAKKLIQDEHNRLFQTWQNADLQSQKKRRMLI